MKIKDVCPVKDPVKRMKRSYWEEVFVNHIPEGGLLSRIYKELWKLNSWETNQLAKRQKALRYFTKEDIQMAHKHMKRCSTLAAIREMQIKSKMRYHYTPTIMTKIKKRDTPNSGEDAEKLDHFHTADGNV